MRRQLGESARMAQAMPSSVPVIQPLRKVSKRSRISSLSCEAMSMGMVEQFQGTWMTLSSATSSPQLGDPPGRPSFLRAL